MMTRPYSFDRACRMFSNRYTLEHVPTWARGAYQHDTLGAVYYAPQYKSDREWYDSSSFPGEGIVPARADYMERGPATWPLGQGFLVAPYVPGGPVPKLAQADPRTAAAQVTPLAVAVAEYDGQMNAEERAPTGDDYNALFDLVVTRLPAWAALLDRVESFVSGFADDDTQEGIEALLSDIRAAQGESV